ncbi:MAG: benzoate--CoA ligase [Rhodobacteraceae bacterium PARR1]|nr:MAG: benzoate--CoA ligase [Rhodobacteraceae bacterium PARR1]
MLSIHQAPAFPPCPAPFNLAAHVLRRAGELADKNALQIVGTTGAERWSYGRLAAAVQGCATGLLARGLGPGDRVLIRLGNTVEFPVLFLGAITAGLIPIPTSAALTVPEITKLATLCRPALIVAADGVALPDPLPCPVLSAADLRAMEALPPTDFAMGDPDRAAYIVFTSGTSGNPRGVVHAHRALWARGMMHQGWEGLGESDRLLHAGAFNWTYTLGTGLLDPWSMGATALIPGAGVTPAQLPLLLKRFDATIFAAAPGVFRQMMRAPLPPLPRLRHALSAGEKLPDSLRAAWEQATGTQVHEALGMSEVSTFLSGSPARPAPAGATGYPQPGRKVAILGPDDQPVPRTEAGILAISADDPGLMLGYLDAPEATADKHRNGWFVTGDSAVMADDGAVTYLGRDDDMMNPGGFRVSPLDVESALAALIPDCAVTEVEVSPGTRIIACFYVAPKMVAEATLQAHADITLARWKQPRHWQRLDALPRGANNKLNRRALAALYRKDQ